MTKQFDIELGTMMRTIRKEKRITIDHVVRIMSESLHFTNIKRTLAETGDVLLSVSMA